MSRTATRLLLLAVACAVGVTLVLWVQRLRTPEGPAEATIRAATRAEPVTLNPLVAADLASLMVTRLLHTTLVRIDHATQEVVPALATSWTPYPDGRRYRLALDPAARFSDGAPVTADDVVFSFEAAYHPSVKSTLASGLLVGGEPIAVTAVEPHTVELTYPAPYGPGLRPLHALPILPSHRLRDALDAGTLRDAWSLTTPPDELVGAGPFALEGITPGIGVTVVRQPHAWQRDADGRTLPRVTRLELRLMASQDAEMLALASGELDIPTGDLRPEDVPEARRLADEGVLQVTELGVSLAPDLLWFNLNPDARATRDKPWLRERALREAISHAVDRQAFIDAVFHGEAEAVTGPVTPGNRQWHVEDIEPREFSRERAAALLDGLGLVDRDGDGLRDDPSGRRASFAVLVQQGHSSRQRAMTVVQEALRQVGLHMDIVALDARSLFGRLGEGTYEAMYHALPATDTDPAGYGEFWLSSGQLHLWHPAQTSPATAWEAEMDRLFLAHVATTDIDDRTRLFGDVLRLHHRELPTIAFAAPRVHVAVSGRLTGVRPGLLAPPVLWQAAEIGVR